MLRPHPLESFLQDSVPFLDFLQNFRMLGPKFFESFDIRPKFRRRNRLFSVEEFFGPGIDVEALQRPRYEMAAKLGHRLTHGQVDREFLCRGFPPGMPVSTVTIRIDSTIRLKQN